VLYPLSYEGGGMQKIWQRTPGPALQGQVATLAGGAQPGLTAMPMTVS
jgi:hypothetical protein